MRQKLKFPEDIRPDFSGFSPEAFKFLHDLKKNNDRKWFKAHKNKYETEVKFSMECLLGEFTSDRRPDNFPLRGNPIQGMFRIYRDVRFSKDKKPYKTHCGAILTRSGNKGDQGIIYIHIEPRMSFLSAGFYSPDKDFLRAWRTRMASDPQWVLTLIKPFVNPDTKYFLRHRGTLKTMPRGFREYANNPVSDYMKWKHFLIGFQVTDKEAQSRKLVDLVIELADNALPFLTYGWQI